MTNPFEPSAPLIDIEVRVLGALIEKEHTTPDSYPLSLNALTAACNQTSNREPVMTLEEHVVSAAVAELRKRSLVRAIIHSGGRVTKYRQLMDETMGLVRRQLAVLSVLMLRGPQTVGELRTRTQRQHDFADLEEVESTLEGLIDRQPPLVARLPRRTGQKEQRFAHLLAGEPSAEVLEAAEGREEPAVRGTPVAERVAALEEAVSALREEVAALRGELEGFRRQFE
ncbi:MAG TPA: DUF480 domain-containing protein [Gemmatimonadaceae bacterium]|nr:DUF480 domain-containing protein [Gemmatimonadaceae bacterium]